MRFLIGTALRFSWNPLKSDLPLFFSTIPVLELDGGGGGGGGGPGEELEGGHNVIKEGEARIFADPSSNVFYNKVQVHNRDMSLAVLRTFISKREEEYAAMSSMNNKIKLNSEGSEKTIASKAEFKKPRVLEALAASGLRSLRYALEVDGIGQVVALDNDKKSVDACKRNIQLNGSITSQKMEAHLFDARVYMLMHPKEFDVVDLDPYGSPSVFLDSAVQSLTDGGLLMCSATDLSVLCGENAEVCYSKYGCYPTKGKYFHEMAARILLACIENHANRHKRYIIPILSVHIDFYIRVFVRIFTSASETRKTPLKLSYVYQCVGCDSFHLQSLGRTARKYNSLKYSPGFGPAVPKLCSDCGMKFNMGGPIWSDPVHDQEWVTSIWENVKATKEKYPAYKKIVSVLTSISEELPDVPLFVSPHSLSAVLRCPCPSALMFRSAIVNAGYRISGCHVNPLGLKTDAPMDVIWDIMRCWVKRQSLEPKPNNPSGRAILSKEAILQANFDLKDASQCKIQTKKGPRFLPNPEKYWGPKKRATRKQNPFLVEENVQTNQQVNDAFNTVKGETNGCDEPTFKMYST